MAIHLNVDGVRTENPSDTDIAHSFESLDKNETRLLSGPGLSMIILSRSETEDLTATGTYAQGFVLGSQNGGQLMSTDIRQPVPVDKVIKAFQSYARGEDWGQSTYQWEHVGSMNRLPANKRLIVALIVVVVLAFIILKLLFSR